MNLIILLIILIVIFLVINCEQVEKLENLDDHSNLNISEKCCEVRKIIQPNNTFLYEYNVKENCKNDYNSNVRYIFENEIVDDKPFTLDKCSNENKEIGSCRRIGFECIDFVTPNDCKKYDMKWSDKTCHDKLPVDIIYPDYQISSDLKTITR
jgi:hypothetical protein